MLAGLQSEAGVLSDGGMLFFENRVRPLLAENCWKCHGPAKHKAGLRLDSIDAILAGGDQGPAIVPGDPEASLLLRGVRYADELFQMPPTGKLPDESIATLEEWVRRGAPGPRGESAEALSEAFDLEARRAAQWAFQPLRDGLPPLVEHTGWLSDALDAFVLARLEAAGLEPTPPVDRATWIRRASFDLTGLPPAPEDVQSLRVGRCSGRRGARRRSAARLAALRRALGAPLARPRPLRGDARPRVRLPAARMPGSTATT